MLKKIFNNQSADGNSLEVENISGKARFKVSGDFGGGTVNLQIKVKDASLSDSFTNTGNAYTEDASFDIQPGSSFVYRLSLTGATSPNINAYVEDGLI